MTCTPVIILGAGGHATVLAEMLRVLKRPVLGTVAPQESLLKNYPEVPYLGTDSILSERFSPTDIQLVNGIGAIDVAGNQRRYQLFWHFKQQGFSFASLVHPSVTMASSVSLGEGVQIMAGGVIQPNSYIGNNTIINTRVSIDHDCHIGDNVHLAPGVVLSGNVQIEEGAHIGTAAAILQGRKIGKQAMICAGQMVIKDVLPFQKLRELKSSATN